MAHPASAMILDVGCGLNKTPGAIGIDINPFTEADVLVDINLFPWPFSSNTFDRIVCRHIVEHVVDLVRFMEEVYRVGTPGGIVEIVTPHFSNRYSYTDPTHLRHLAWRSFDYFVEPANRPLSRLDRLLELRHPIPRFYSRAHFRVRRRFLDFGRPYRWLGIQKFANQWPDLYELYLAFVFPARDLYLELEIVK